jgi:alpha-ketoglutarate-dependent taurine dioxygenase
MVFYNQFVGKKSDFSTLFSNSKVLHILHIENIDTNNYFTELAQECGIPLIYEEDPITGLIQINKWTEIKYEADKSNQAYKSSNKFQPLHTDYGYFSFEIFSSFFYCVEQAEFGGATTFIDVDKVVDLLQLIDFSLFEQLNSTKIHFGRADNPIAHNEDFILSKDEIGWKINWNYYRALNDHKNALLISNFKAFLDNYLEKSGELTEIKLKPGEGVFFHDRRVLHGRNSFIGNRQLNKGGIAKNVPTEILQMFKSND